MRNLNYFYSDFIAIQFEKLLDNELFCPEGGLGAVFTIILKRFLTFWIFKTILNQYS